MAYDNEKYGTIIRTYPWMNARAALGANASLVKMHHPKTPIVITKIGFTVATPKAEKIAASVFLINMLADGVAGVRASIRPASASSPILTKGAVASKSSLSVVIGSGSYLVFNAYGSVRDICGEIFYEWRRQYDATGVFEV